MTRPDPSIPVIGLTGGIGAGKSLVARQFAALGCAVLDADRLAREALQAPGVRETLTAWWGRDVLEESGGIDRRKVAAAVFENPAELARLEELLHPGIHARRRELRRDYEADPSVRAIVEDSPLLWEKGIAGECDVIVHVHAPRPMRLSRVARDRGWGEAELNRREKNQWPLDNKLERADYVVTNDADEDRCFHQVRRVFSLILSRRRDDAADPVT